MSVVVFRHWALRTGAPIIALAHGSDEWLVACYGARAKFAQELLAFTGVR
jgi:hypothetical protein